MSESAARALAPVTIHDSSVRQLVMSSHDRGSLKDMFVQADLIEGLPHSQHHKWGLRDSQRTINTIIVNKNGC